jgi:hypothetical protein
LIAVIAEQTAQKRSAPDRRIYLPITKFEFHAFAGPFECYFIPAPVGLRPDSYDLLRAFLEDLVATFIARFGCNHESFIEAGAGKDTAAMTQFSINARTWIPEAGQGVWPNRPAPRMMKMADFEDIESPAKMPSILNPVFRLTAPANARFDAMSTMAGSGCSLQILTALEGPVLMSNLKELFLDFIEDRLFRIFPWYVPLLDKAALTDPMRSLAANSIRDVALYIRESPEDGGILIMSAEPLAEILRRCGCRQIEDEPTPRWKLGG